MKCIDERDASPRHPDRVAAARYRFAAVGLVAGLTAGVAFGAEARILRTAGAGPFLEGTADGVSIDRLGLVRLAQRFERIAEIAEPFLLTAERHPGGWVVGTGNDGRVLLVGEDGEISTLLDSEEQEVFALHVLDDGTIYAGTSPEGAVYRIEPTAEVGAEPEVFEVVRPGEQYIWDLERDASGRLLVATGVEGKLLRVTETAGEDGGRQSTVETLYDATDPHIRSVLARGDDALIGTAGEGRILRVDASGRATSLYDADQPEITSLIEGLDGVVFAAAVASEASLVDLSANGGGGNGGGQKTATGGDSADVQVQEGAASAGSRPAGYQGPRSEILRLSANGSVESVAQLRRETVYDLARRGEQLIVATGQQGKLYSWRDGGELVLEQDLDSRQLVRILGDDGANDVGSLAIAATDGAALFAAVEGSRPEGAYRSKVHDTRYVSTLGSLHWEGDVADGGMEFAVRTGFSASPDDTWSDWREVGSAGTPGVALALADVPPGRYLQWRAQLRAPGDDANSPRLDAVEISYLQQNQRPRIQELEVLPPGEVLVPSGFNPANQAFEALTPNRDGVFVRIGKPASERSKKLWKLGYRTLTWKAEDPNADDLEYSLHVRSDDMATSADRSDSPAEPAWMAVEDELEENQFSFDSTVMPDGRYRFRLTVNDRKSQGDRSLSAEKVSGPVIVDHTPPEIRVIARDSAAVRLEVRDALLPIRSVEYSVDAGPWQNAQVADGLLDARVEQVEVAAPQGAQWVLIRVVDGAFNQQTHDLARIGTSSAGDSRSRGR